MTITEFEIIDHGIDHEQYFPGCGVAFTSYTHCVTGAGDNFADAWDDACEMMAQSSECDNVDFDALNKAALKQIGRRKFPRRPGVRADDVDHYYYVSIRYNVAPNPADDAPAESDYTTTDHQHFYADGKLMLVIPDGASTAEMWSAIDAQMERDGFFPDVWFISDHGNAHRMTRE